WGGDVVKQAGDLSVLRSRPAQRGLRELRRDLRAGISIRAAHLGKRRDFAVAARAALERDPDEQVLRRHQSPRRHREWVGDGYVNGPDLDLRDDVLRRHRLRTLQ